jgi:hypothetical protein
MTDIELPGVAGTNPLGLLAALGLVRTLARTSEAATLRWIDGPVPVPVVTGASSPDELVERVLADRDQWRQAPVFEFEGIDDVKLLPSELGHYLAACNQDPERSGELAAALVTERVIDGKGVAKPTDLHFTAGQQKFLHMAREIRDGVTGDDIAAALTESWSYSSKLPSLGWDVADDRLYALSAINPSKDKKQSEPGAEWLALLGLSCLPVTIGDERTLTPGCQGSWKSGTFTWPLWSTPIGHEACRSLLATVTTASGGASPEALEATGCFALMQSGIRRSDQGGYGTFGPPTIVWQRRHQTTSPPDPFQE